MKAGCENLIKHIRNVKSFGVPVTVSINPFINDSDAEMAAAEAEVVKAFVASHWADGGAGTEELARHVIELADSGEADFQPLYPDDMPLIDKVRTVVRKIYGGGDIACDGAIAKRFEELQADYGHFPVCMAKTQYSFSIDPDLKGAPSGFTVPIRELRLSAGAAFLTDAVVVSAEDDRCAEQDHRVEELIVEQVADRRDEGQARELEGRDEGHVGGGQGAGQCVVRREAGERREREPWQVARFRGHPDKDRSGGAQQGLHRNHVEQDGERVLGPGQPFGAGRGRHRNIRRQRRRFLRQRARRDDQRPL